MAQAKSNEMDNVLAFFQEDNVQPFDVEYQNKFLKVFISDKDGFSDRIHDVVQADYFDSYQKILLDYELKFFAKYREVAKFSSLRDLIKEKEKGLNKDHLIGLIDKIEELPLDNVQHIKDSSYNYFKERSVKNCIMQMVVDWKKHNYDSMKTNLETALRAGEPKETGHDYHTDMEKRLKGDYRNPISAMPSIDKYIGGGLSGGEMGLILAPTGGGKSMMLVKFACNAFLLGKKVLYYTLELSQEAVGNRFDSCINQIKLKEVQEFPDIIRETADAIKENGGRLIIKGFESGFATINTIISHIKTLQINDNFVPDIIFIDYGDLLKPTENFSEKRHSLDSIYIAIRGLATQLNVPIWNAAQTNRSGMEQEHVSLSSIGESLGNARAADVVIGVGRTSDDKLNNVATIGILKNRNGGDGFYLPAHFDTTKIFIECLDVKPENIMVPKKPSNNRKTEKPNQGDESKKTNDTDNDISNILGGQK